MIEVPHLVHISISLSLCFHATFDEVTECFCDVVAAPSKHGCQAS